MNIELMTRAGPLGLDSGSCSSVGDALEARVHMIARFAPLLEGLLAQHSQQQQALVSALSPSHGLLQPLHSQPSSLAMSGSASCLSPPHASVSPPAAFGDRSRVPGNSDQLGQLGISISAAAGEVDPMSTPSNDVATTWISALAALIQSYSQNGKTRTATGQASVVQVQDDQRLSMTSMAEMLE